MYRKNRQKKKLDVHLRQRNLSNNLFSIDYIQNLDLEESKRILVECDTLIHSAEQMVTHKVHMGALCHNEVNILNTLTRPELQTNSVTSRSGDRKFASLLLGESSIELTEKKDGQPSKPHEKQANRKMLIEMSRLSRETALIAPSNVGQRNVMIPVYNSKYISEYVQFLINNERAQRNYGLGGYLKHAGKIAIPTVLIGGMVYFAPAFLPCAFMSTVSSAVSYFPLNITLSKAVLNFGTTFTVVASVFSVLDGAVKTSMYGDVGYVKKSAENAVKKIVLHAVCAPVMALAPGFGALAFIITVFFNTKTGLISRVISVDTVYVGPVEQAIREKNDEREARKKAERDFEEQKLEYLQAVKLYGTGDARMIEMLKWGDTSQLAIHRRFLQYFKMFPRRFYYSSKDAVQNPRKVWMYVKNNILMNHWFHKFVAGLAVTYFFKDIIGDAVMSEYSAEAIKMQDVSVWEWSHTFIKGHVAMILLQVISGMLGWAGSLQYKRDMFVDTILIPFIVSLIIKGGVSLVSLAWSLNPWINKQLETIGSKTPLGKVPAEYHRKFVNKIVEVLEYQVIGDLAVLNVADAFARGAIPTFVQVMEENQLFNNVLDMSKLENLPRLANTILHFTDNYDMLHPTKFMEYDNPHVGDILYRVDGNAFVPSYQIVSAPPLSAVLPGEIGSNVPNTSPELLIVPFSDKGTDLDYTQASPYWPGSPMLTDGLFVARDGIRFDTTKDDDIEAVYVPADFTQTELFGYTGLSGSDALLQDDIAKMLVPTTSEGSETMPVWEKETVGRLVDTLSKVQQDGRRQDAANVMVRSYEIMVGRMEKILAELNNCLTELSDITNNMDNGPSLHNALERASFLTFSERVALFGTIGAAEKAGINARGAMVAQFAVVRQRLMDEILSVQSDIGAFEEQVKHITENGESSESMVDNFVTHVYFFQSIFQPDSPLVERLLLKNNGLVSFPENLRVLTNSFFVTSNSAAYTCAVYLDRAQRAFRALLPWFDTHDMPKRYIEGVETLTADTFVASAPSVVTQWVEIGEKFIESMFSNEATEAQKSTATWIGARSAAIRDKLSLQKTKNNSHDIGEIDDLLTQLAVVESFLKLPADSARLDPYRTELGKNEGDMLRLKSLLPSDLEVDEKSFLKYALPSQLAAIDNLKVLTKVMNEKYGEGWSKKIVVDKVAEVRRKGVQLKSTFKRLAGYAQRQESPKKRSIELKASESALPSISKRIPKESKSVRAFAGEGGTIKIVYTNSVEDLLLLTALHIEDLPQVENGSLQAFLSDLSTALDRELHMWNSLASRLLSDDIDKLPTWDSDSHFSRKLETFVTETAQMGYMSPKQANELLGMWDKINKVMLMSKVHGTIDTNGIKKVADEFKATVNDAELLMVDFMNNVELDLTKFREKWDLAADTFLGPLEERMEEIVNKMKTSNVSYFDTTVAFFKKMYGNDDLVQDETSGAVAAISGILDRLKTDKFEGSSVLASFGDVMNAFDGLQRAHRRNGKLMAPRTNMSVLRAQDAVIKNIADLLVTMKIDAESSLLANGEDVEISDVLDSIDRVDKLVQSFLSDVTFALRGKENIEWNVMYLGDGVNSVFAALNEAMTKFSGSSRITASAGSSVRVRNDDFELTKLFLERLGMKNEENVGNVLNGTVFKNAGELTGMIAQLDAFENELSAKYLANGHIPVEKVNFLVQEVPFLDQKEREQMRYVLSSIYDMKKNLQMADDTAGIDKIDKLLSDFITSSSSALKNYDLETKKWSSISGAVFAKHARQSAVALIEEKKKIFQTYQIVNRNLKMQETHYRMNLSNEDLIRAENLSEMTGKPRIEFLSENNKQKISTRVGSYKQFIDAYNDGMRMMRSVRMYKEMDLMDAALKQLLRGDVNFKQSFLFKNMHDREVFRGTFGELMSINEKNLEMSRVKSEKMHEISKKYEGTHLGYCAANGGSMQVEVHRGIGIVAVNRKTGMADQVYMDMCWNEPLFVKLQNTVTSVSNNMVGKSFEEVGYKTMGAAAFGAIGGGITGFIGGNAPGALFGAMQGAEMAVGSIALPLKAAVAESSLQFLLEKAEGYSNNNPTVSFLREILVLGNKEKFTDKEFHMTHNANIDTFHLLTEILDAPDFETKLEAVKGSIDAVRDYSNSLSTFTVEEGVVYAALYAKHTDLLAKVQNLVAPEIVKNAALSLLGGAMSNLDHISGGLASSTVVATGEIGKMAENAAYALLIYRAFGLVEMMLKVNYYGYKAGILEALLLGTESTSTLRANWEKTQSRFMQTTDIDTQILDGAAGWIRSFLPDLPMT